MHDFENWTNARLAGSLLAKFLDSEFDSDKIYNPDSDQSLGFKLLFDPNRVLSSDPFRPKNTAFVINNWVGRFGNNVLQLRNSYLLANLLGAQTIVAPDNKFFRSGESDNISFQFGTALPDDISVVILGEFFPTPFRHYFNIFGEKNIVDFYHDLRPNLKLRPHAGLTDRDLVLFVRSGDIFTIEQDFIRGYGQPPLSFYEAVIEIEQPERIFVLAEDDSNPVVKGLFDKNWPNIEKIRLGMHGDFEFMLGAQKIATGTTTLLPNLLNFSTDIRMCYSFEDGLKSFKGHFENVVISDEAGYYKDQILNNNWVHSPEQLDLMIQYPISNLKIPNR